MTQPHISFVIPETDDEIGQSTLLTSWPWGLVVEVHEENNGDNTYHSMLLTTAQVIELREFLNRMDA